MIGKKTKLNSILGMMMLLAGCMGTGTIEKSFDEFTQKNVCTVKVPAIVKGWGQAGSLWIENVGGDLKTILLTTTVLSPLIKSKGFANNPDIILVLQNSVGEKETITFKSQTIGKKIRKQPEYYNGIFIGNTYFNDETHQFHLSKEQLIHLANAAQAELTISNKNAHLEGQLSNSEIELLKSFTVQCVDKAQ